MRLNVLGFLRLCSLLILLAFFLLPAFAGIRPSFELDYCTWHATHVVLVEVTAAEGVFSVVEPWKGELQPRERITIPELTPAFDAKPISVFPTRSDFLARDMAGLGEQIPRQPVGSRMVLFLKRGEGSEVSPTSTDTNSGEKWRPADMFDQMKTSTVWIDGEQVYSFQQLINPSPSEFFVLHSSIQQMKARVAEINRIQKELAVVVSNGNSGARAEGLKPYVRSKLFEAQRLALNELGKCGPSALSTIRGMLDDPAFADEAAELVSSFAEAGGELVGEELNSRLQKELAFWQATAPSLSPGRWNQDPTPHAPLRERYMQTFQLILALARTHYTPASITATQLGGFWRSLPQLNDPSGLNQIAEECEKLVNHVRAN
jgi:hypothetical protein